MGLCLESCVCKSVKKLKKGHFTLRYDWERVLENVILSSNIKSKIYGTANTCGNLDSYMYTVKKVMLQRYCLIFTIILLFKWAEFYILAVVYELNKDMFARPVSNGNKIALNKLVHLT